MSGCSQCGFDDWELWDANGRTAEWHRRHLARHVATFPGLDFRTRRNLELFIEWAERDGR